MRLRATLKQSEFAMSKKRPSLKHPRARAFAAQNGRCYYCRQPMWKNDPVAFCNRYGITQRQARAFQCTGEHLRPHKDGGEVSTSNIVAACHCCNQRRHRGRKSELAPPDYRALVMKRMAQGQWHLLRLGASG